MKTGTVKFYNYDKGFGFISQDDRLADVFVHVSDLGRNSIRGLEGGDKVEYTTKKGKRGLQVDKLEVVR